MKQGTREKLVWMAHAIHQAILSDDDGITRQVLGDVKEEIEKMYGAGGLAHGCASTQKEVK